MPKISVPHDEYLTQTLRRLRSPGLLLVTAGANGKPNPMTIGWAAIGTFWAKPCFTIVVRPSRYSYLLLVESGDFTVNVAPPSLAETVAYCGKVSGRDHDKFAERGLTAMPSATVRAPIIAECVVHYECRTLYQDDLDPEALPAAVRTQCYPRQDYHRVFIGEILATSADPDAARLLGAQG
ncbi:MAG: flavin reductase family protein [Candidatus Latescibacterota bacterium]